MLYFRFPFSEKIYTTDENSDKNPVSFFSFDQSEVIDFEGDIEEITIEDFAKQHYNSDLLSSNLMEFWEEKQPKYQEKLVEVIDFIKINDLSKLVISRRKLLNFNGSKINLSETFLNLCEAYPNAFVYFFIKDGKCWLGAFSEVLGKFNKKTSQFETMSLAGTIPVNEDWTSKEIEEQQPVTDFIHDVLKEFSEEIEQSETYDHISGNIKHLRTDFKVKIKAENLEKIISELHPTPAVCGIPKDFCKNAIRQFEKHSRNLYAGYIRVETEDYIQYFVNLRCAEFFKNAALIYVGGGITADSSVEKEWNETELKAEAILKNIAFT
ncbi:chorismate-binding protein [Kaistella jeonii]|uniref:Isochorismate synthase n=1 Tax=Kaistella jeonii TaxID=266749 RepID=A0A0C1FJW2_9FLAO|nr:chorismate-binding protein [Kaistella jeonii]KIA88214.1 isochorismate synthase [Kaistella jeonii]SFC25984.1 isochorismate synthase [Kaistella jeonii]VEI95677.1 Isochorismate synthase entC [Kaistella jeonii]